MESEENEEMKDDGGGLSENTPAEDVIRRLEQMNFLPPNLIMQMRTLAEHGVHPLQFLQMVQETQRRQQEESPQEQVLETLDLQGLARYLVDKECKRVVVMCGAGISTSAGIPDFRTPGTGLYDNLQRFNLPAPEAIFQIDFFRQNPGAFYELAKEMWPGQYDPTPAHYFIRLLHEKGVLLRCYSQNIDSLEAQAGLPAEKLVAAHGNFDKAHVLKKDYEDENEEEVEVDINELKAAIDKGEEGWQALRQEKGDLVKPKIVFFGEPLPQRFLNLHREDLRSCDMLIVMGTSLVVGPFNSLVGLATPTAPRLLINRETAGLCEDLPRGFRFHKTEEGQNWRDVWLQGDCDAGCRTLAAALGWGADLEALVQSKGQASVARVAWAPSPATPATSSSPEPA